MVAVKLDRVQIAQDPAVAPATSDWARASIQESWLLVEVEVAVPESRSWLARVVVSSPLTAKMARR
jgi:hypothetical protein